MAHKFGIEIDLMMYLASLHSGQWFGFDDSGNREYEKLYVKRRYFRRRQRNYKNNATSNGHTIRRIFRY